MRYALGAASLTQIRNMVSGRPMLAFDIDGTLAPIVAEPWRAHISEELRACLRSLAARTPVAIITGRAVKDARPLLGFSPHYVVGNHGAEGIPGFEAQSTGFQRVCAAWLAELSATPDARGWRAMPGIMLEDKQYSLSFHYRHTARPGLARELLEQRIARLVPPPDIVHGSACSTCCRRMRRTKVRRCKACSAFPAVRGQCISATMSPMKTYSACACRKFCRSGSGESGRVPPKCI